MIQAPAVSPHDLVRLDTSVPGFKAARLWVELYGDTAAGFMGIGVDGAYGRDDLAQCIHERTHVPPEAGCSCGYYGWRAQASAVDILDPDEAPALLSVELSGRFDEYEHGFVAYRQHVTTVLVMPYCVECVRGPRKRRRWERPVALIYGLAVEPTCGHDTPVLELRPACASHIRRRERRVPDSRASMTLQEFARLSGVPTAWLPPDRGLHRRLKTGYVPAPPTTLMPARPKRTVGGHLAADRIGYMFPTEIHQDPAGGLWVRPEARLVQPQPGVDIPIWRTDDGELVALLRGVVPPAAGWRRCGAQPDGMVPLRVERRRWYYISEARPREEPARYGASFTKRDAQRRAAIEAREWRQDGLKTRKTDHGYLVATDRTFTNASTLRVDAGAL